MIYKWLILNIKSYIKKLLKWEKDYNKDKLQKNLEKCCLMQKKHYLKHKLEIFKIKYVIMNKCYYIQNKNAGIKILNNFFLER